MGKMICFDLDGTLADLYSVPDWLEKLYNEDPTPYTEAKPLYDMNYLNSILRALIEQGWEVRIISWLAKGSTSSYKDATRKAKLDWLERHNFPYSTAHFVAYGTTKADCVRHKAETAILIDDNKKVRQGWHLGETIDPTTENLFKKLKELLK